jgi:hypothetical protein
VYYEGFKIMVKIEFKTDNDSFQGEHGRWQIKSILEEVSCGIFCGNPEGKIIDINGNTIGTWSFDNE